MKKKSMLLAAAALCVMLMAVGCGTKESPWSQYAKLGEYKGLEVLKISTEVSEEELNGELDKVLEQNVTYKEVKEGTVKDGDTVNIDYEGKKGGVAFEGGTAQGHNLIIGSNSFIPGFESGLIGTKVGETVDLDITFPKDYQSADLAGQAVVFTVTANYIQGEKIVPAWTDEFVQGISEFKTVAEYTENLKKTMVENKETTAKSNQKYELVSKVVENASIDSYPEEKVTEYIDRMKKEFEQQAAMYGMEYEALLSGMFGMTPEDFDKEMDKAAHSVVGQNMVLDMIAQKEKIKFTEEELKTEGLAYVQQYGFDSVESFEEQYGAGIVAEDLLREKVTDFLMESAVFVDKLTETAAPEASAAPEDAASADTTAVPEASEVPAE